MQPRSISKNAGSSARYVCRTTNQNQLVCESENATPLVSKPRNCHTRQNSHEISGANLDTRLVVKHLIDQSSLTGSSNPPDTIMAVGPDVIVAAVNNSIGIFDKATFQTLMLEGNGSFYGPTGAFAGDVQVIYDELSQRFFTECWQLNILDAQLSITAPGPAVGIYGAKLGTSPVSQNPFSVTGKIVQAIPANGNAALTNVSDITGNIALIATASYGAGGGGTLTKGNHAAAAGAIGCIIYDSTGSDFSSGIFGSTLIPTILVDYATGQLLLANSTSTSSSPLIGTMDHALIVTQSSTFNIAVSKTSSPKSTTDWYKYQFATAIYEAGLPDFPKISVDLNNFYLSTQDYTSPDAFTGYQADISILDKADLVNGVGVTLISQNTFPFQQFLWPARITPPLTNLTYPAFFVGTNANIETGTGGNSTALRVYKTPSYDFSTNFDYVEIPYPTPMDFGFTLGGSIPQSPLVAPISAFTEVPLTAVVYKDSLWVAQAWGTTKQLIRWYELDISLVVSDNIITIKQWGDIDSRTTSSVAYPSINVDKDGNMGIAFLMGGLDLKASIAYTGRLANDPPGTTRFPIQIAQTQEYLYDGANAEKPLPPDGSTTILVNRWGDYSSLVVDPVDHKTFYIFQQLADDSPFSVDPSTGISYQWTTTAATFQINKACH